LPPTVTPPFVDDCHGTKDGSGQPSPDFRAAYQVMDKIMTCSAGHWSIQQSRSMPWLHQALGAANSLFAARQ